MLKNLIAVIIAVALGAFGYALWNRKDAEESPLNIMITQMRTRAIIEHERQVTVWYKACPEVKGINPQVMVIWPAKLNYELDLAATKLSLSPDGVLRADTPPIRGDDPSVPSEVGEYLAEAGLDVADVGAVVADEHHEQRRGVGEIRQPRLLAGDGGEGEVRGRGAERHDVRSRESHASSLYSPSS